MGGYTKLFSDIVTSSIWSEDDKTRIVWVTILALVDGPEGFVPASIPGLANAARVTLEECEAAVAKLEAHDRYSRSRDNDGRRIERVDGGWVVLNYGKYRDRLSSDHRKVADRERQRKHRMLSRDGHVTSRDGHVTSRDAASASVDAAGSLEGEGTGEREQPAKDTAGIPQGYHADITPLQPVTSVTGGTVTPCNDLTANQPTLDQCLAAAAPIGMARADVEACYNHYASQGWVKGNGQRITSLHALLAKWKANGANHGNAHGQGGNWRKRSGPIVPDYGDENDPLIGDAVRKMREETTVK